VSDIKKFALEAHGKKSLNIIISMIMWLIFLAVETIGQLEKDLEQAREAAHYAEAQEVVGHQTHTRKVEECNQLKAEKDQQALEIETLKSQMAAFGKRSSRPANFLRVSNLPVVDFARFSRVKKYLLYFVQLFYLTGLMNPAMHI
jgi:hypothetical protein